MTADATIAISIVIPAYREAARIAKTLAAVSEYFTARALPFEIIVADDGSDDDTARAAGEAASEIGGVRVVSLGQHRGKGAAVRAGILATGGEYVLLSDADLAIPLSLYEDLSAALDDGSDVAIASKELGRRGGIVDQSRLRVLMGRVFNLAVRAVVLGGILDTQAGFKLFRGDLARDLASRSRIDSFAYDVELLALAVKAGRTVVEIPALCRLTGSTSVRVLSDSVGMLLDLVAIRLRLGRVKVRPGAPYADN